MTISSSGIGSGLDVDSIVTQLMQLEQKPLVALATRESQFTAQLSTFGTIKGALSTFQSAAAALKTAGGTTAFGFSTSDSGSITGSAASTASAGTYNVSVTQLAQAQLLVSGGQASASAKIGDGTATTLNFSFGTIAGGSFDNNTGLYTGATYTVDPDRTVTPVTIDSSNNTLEGVRDAINAANAGVTATIVNDGSGTPYRLSVTSTASGVKSSLKITASGNAAVADLLAYDPAGTQNLKQTQAARNAELTVNGIAISRPSNNVADAIAGVTLKLSKVAADVTVTVARSTTSIRSALDALVKAYNDANKSIASATAYKAILQGDSATLGIQNRLRAALGTVNGNTSGSIDSLSQLGVAFQKDGSLALDGNKLQAAIDADYPGVMAAAVAFGTSLSALADNLVGTTGAVQSRTDGINRSVADIGRQRDSFSTRLTAIEKRYRTQFTALDVTMSNMQKTSNFLTQQLASLPK